MTVGVQTPAVIDLMEDMPLRKFTFSAHAAGIGACIPHPACFGHPGSTEFDQSGIWGNVKPCPYLVQCFPYSRPIHGHSQDSGSDRYCGYNARHQFELTYR